MRDLERERATWEARHLIIEKIREFYPEEVAQAEREVAAEMEKERRIRVRLAGDPPKRRKRRG